MISDGKGSTMICPLCGKMISGSSIYREFRCRCGFSKEFVPDSVSDMITVAKLFETSRECDQKARDLLEKIVTSLKIDMHIRKMGEHALVVNHSDLVGSTDLSPSTYDIKRQTMHLIGRIRKARDPLMDLASSVEKGTITTDTEKYQMHPALRRALKKLIS